MIKNIRQANLHWRIAAAARAARSWAYGVRMGRVDGAFNAPCVLCRVGSDPEKRQLTAERVNCPRQLADYRIPVAVRRLPSAVPPDQQDIRYARHVGPVGHGYVPCRSRRTSAAVTKRHRRRDDAVRRSRGAVAPRFSVPVSGSRELFPGGC